MPAVIPFIPLITAALGTGVTMYSGNKARQQQKDAMKKQEALAGKVTPGADQFLHQGQGAIGQGMNYYASMLNDPRSSTAPEQNRISSMYAGQAANVRNQSPRGGYGPSAAGSIRDRQNAAQEGIIQQGRPAAAQGLSQLGLGTAGLGYQGYGLGSSILGNVFNQGLAAREQQFNQGSQLGSGLFNAYQGYLLSRATQPSGIGASSGNSGNASGYLGLFNTPSGTSGQSGSGFSQFGSGQAGLYGGQSLPNSGQPGSHP